MQRLCSSSYPWPLRPMQEEGAVEAGVGAVEGAAVSREAEDAASLVEAGSPEVAGEDGVSRVAAPMEAEVASIDPGLRAPGAFPHDLLWAPQAGPPHSTVPGLELTAAIPHPRGGAMRGPRTVSARRDRPCEPRTGRRVEPNGPKPAPIWAETGNRAELTGRKRVRMEEQTGPKDDRM